MLVPWCAYGVVVLALADGAGSAADVVTLNDGTVLNGQVVGGAGFGGRTVLVRRDWARGNAPEWLGRWERQEAPKVLHGRRERKARLIAWRRERAGTAGADRLAAWIDREVTRLSTPRPVSTVLTAAVLTRAEVAAVDRRSAEDGRWLRLGWLAGLDDAETLTPPVLGDALRKLAPLRPDDPARVDALLPTYPETEEDWRTRRAATEVAVEPGLRFVRFRQFILPETGTGTGNGPGGEALPRTASELLDSPSGRTALRAIQGVTPFDAVREQLDAIAVRGRVGAIVSRLEFTVDSERVEADSTLWVRSQSGVWAPRVGRNAVVTADRPGEPETPAREGTPIRAALLVLEALASAPASPETSVRRQGVAVRAERALGRARAALDDELGRFVLPVAR